MGRDKALLPYRGVTLAAHIASIVQQVAGSATLVGNPDLYGHLGIPMIADLYPGEGPLGGLITVLKNSQADWNLVLACDLPSLTVPFLESLLADCEDCTGDCLVPVSPGGRLEPMCAVYHSRSRASLEAIFNSGVRKMQTALAELRTVHHPVDEAQWFQNMNTPEEWEAHLSATPDESAL